MNRHGFICDIVESGNCVYCGKRVGNDGHIFLCEECRRKEEEMKEDCYFYFEEHMMEGRIPCCSFDKYGLGVCPCNKCTNYMPRSEVYKLVKSKVLSRRKNDHQNL